MQPSFRASEESVPLPVYSSLDVDGDPWVALRKSGPNGFVAVVMLLAWWGHAATTGRSEWQEDSLPLWATLVRDVRSVLVEMTAMLDVSSSAKAGKRGLDKENLQEGAPSKRYVLVPSSTS